MTHVSELQAMTVSEAGTVETHKGNSFTCLVLRSLVATGGTLDWVILASGRGSQTTLEAK